MLAVPVDLFEDLKSGLIWVQRDGMVRHANRDAVQRTGIAAGRRLADPELVRAVLSTFAGKGPVQVAIQAQSPDAGAAPAKLLCTVQAGLTADDVFVRIAPAPDAEADTAYDSLMQVLRTDLREPLQSTHRALEVARESVDGFALDPLLHNAQELLGVLDKLLDLAQIWGSRALFQNDRIELWPLLQQVWAEIEPIAVGRKVSVQFRAQLESDQLAALYGSETWLRRVFAECFESALRTVPSGGALEIEHRQMGPRAVVVFRNAGVFAARHGVTLPQSAPPPGPAGRSGARSAAPSGSKGQARDHISFKLCSHIVSMHGGQLREEEDDGERHFVIDLPTGAPHRSDEAQIDIAQAQNYARDLSALMARSRARAAASPSANPSLRNRAA
jgi:hypothetical protein